MSLPTGVVHLLAPNASPYTGPGTSSYVVYGPDGGSVVIDPGPDIASHLEALAETAKAHGPLQAILITHGHIDHVEGAANLRTLTGAPVLAWSREGTPTADETLPDGQRLDVGGRGLTVIHTPGHRFDHLCYLLDDERTVFAGDLVAGTGTVVIAPPEGNLQDYLDSLNKLLALDLKQILPGHGPFVDDPKALLEFYLRHRADREQQIIGILREGPATIATLTDRIYAGLEPALRPAAMLSLEAHLIKLRQDGRVGQSDEPNATATWTLIDA